MYTYDNTQNKKRIKSLNASITVNNEEILYTYIRKNACTSFKKFFSHFSEHDFSSIDTPLNAMSYYHKVPNVDSAAKIKNRVFIYRDPVERVVSVFKNKFIQQAGADDILSDFDNRTNLSLNEVTFEKFVTEYVLKLKDGIMIDVHLLPQQWHLLPIVYNNVIPLKNVEKCMSDIIGEDISSKFFSKPLNSTEKILSTITSYCGDVDIKMLRDLYLQSKEFPASHLFVSNEIRHILEDIYADDYLMEGLFKKN